MISVTVTPAPVMATAGSVGLVYGQSLPALTGSVSGVLAQDDGQVTLGLTTTAAALSPVGSYPIVAVLGGAKAGDYRLASVVAGAVQIGKAPTATVITSGAQSVATGTAITVGARVLPAAGGVPTGRVQLAETGTTYGQAALDGSGQAALAVTLGVGSHALVATYAGDGNFLPSTSVAVTEVVTSGAVVVQDFSLAGGGSQTVTGGTAASFGFTVGVQNGPLDSPILLTASGLPAGAAASFSPAYLPPGGAVSAFTLTVQTVKTTAATRGRWGGQMAWLVFGLGMWVRRRTRRLGLLAAVCGVVVLSGCGDRVAQIGGNAAAASAKTYPMTVTGTSTLVSGAVLQHTVAITLVVQ